MRAVDRMRSGSRKLLLRGLGVLALLAAVGVVLGLVLPVKATVEYQSGLLDENGPVPSQSISVSCGSALRGGPARVSYGATFVDDPCRDASRSRRWVLVGGATLAVLLGTAAILLQRKQRNSEADTTTD